MKNPAYCVLGISFVLLLFGFGVLNYYHKDRSFSDTENRMLEQKPQWQISSVLDGRFMKALRPGRRTSSFSGTAGLAFAPPRTGFSGKRIRAVCFWERTAAFTRSRKAWGGSVDESGRHTVLLPASSGAVFLSAAGSGRGRSESGRTAGFCSCRVSGGSAAADFRVSGRRGSEYTGL